MSSIIATSPKTQERVMYIDEVNSNLTYIGVAKFGTATSDAKWQIRRVQKANTVTSIQYADGDKRYNNVWDNRASLTYSN